MKKKIGNILPPPADKCNLNFKNFAAFTLAEILLSLTVIGIVAAIALPSLLGNANERAWETQKKALYTRFSQSLPLLPSLNGYGTLTGTLSSNSDDGKQHVDTDTAAETFVRDGLSKVMKITNICDNNHLSDCGLPDKIIPINGENTLNLSGLKTAGLYNPKFSGNIRFFLGTTEHHYEQLDTKAAAFETVNGESILVYYNPNCEPDLGEMTYGVNNFGDNQLTYLIQPKLCANFIYDLNGKKGPNTAGKDIGAITVLYSTDPIVVSPNPYPNNLSETATFTEAQANCKKMDDNAKLPNIDELASIFYNANLYNFTGTRGGVDHYWSSNRISSTRAWKQSPMSGTRMAGLINDKYYVRCVKR